MIAKKWVDNSFSEVDFRNWKTDFVVWSLVRFKLAKRNAVRFSELYLQSFIHSSCKAEKHSKICFNFFIFYSELTIKDKVLKIFTSQLLTNVNLTRSQTTKLLSGFGDLSLKIKIIFCGAVHTDIFLDSNCNTA